MARSSSSFRPFAALACLFPLVPVLVWPGMGILGSIVAVLVALVVFGDSRNAVLALVWRGKVQSILLGMAFGAALAVGIAEVLRPAVESWLGEGVDIGDLGQIAGKPVVFVVTLVLALVSAALEEMVFRGFVIGWGAKLFGSRSALVLAVLSALVFGLAHQYGPAGAVVTGLAGLAMGLLYIATGRRLLPCVAAHMTFNTIGATALYLAT